MVCLFIFLFLASLINTSLAQTVQARYNKSHDGAIFQVRLSIKRYLDGLDAKLMNTLLQYNEDWHADIDTLRDRAYHDKWSSLGLNVSHYARMTVSLDTVESHRTERDIMNYFQRNFVAELGVISSKLASVECRHCDGKLALEACVQYSMSCALDTLFFYSVVNIERLQPS
jgi:hypothetical protein